jgi:hypothetical protein
MRTTRVELSPTFDSSKLLEGKWMSKKLFTRIVGVKTPI